MVPILFTQHQRPPTGGGRARQKRGAFQRRATKSRSGPLARCCAPCCQPTRTPTPHTWRPRRGAFRQTTTCSRSPPRTGPAPLTSPTSLSYAHTGSPHTPTPLHFFPNTPGVWGQSPRPVAAPRRGEITTPPHPPSASPRHRRRYAAPLPRPCGPRRSSATPPNSARQSALRPPAGWRSSSAASFAAAG